MTTGDVGGDRSEVPRVVVEDFLLTREAAQLLRTSESTLRYWRHIRTGPPSIKIGRRVLYRREALIAWVQGREVRAAEGPAAHVTFAGTASVRGRKIPAPRRGGV